MSTGVDDCPIVKGLGIAKAILRTFWEYGSDSPMGFNRGWWLDDVRWIDLDILDRFARWFHCRCSWHCDIVKPVDCHGQGKVAGHEILNLAGGDGRGHLNLLGGNTVGCLLTNVKTWWWTRFGSAANMTKHVLICFDFHTIFPDHLPINITIISLKNKGDISVHGLARGWTWGFLTKSHFWGMEKLELCHSEWQELDKSALLNRCTLVNHHFKTKLCGI